MMHELGPNARALLDAAREGLGPDADAVRRMRAKIDASIAGGAAGAAAGGGGGALAVKLGIVAVVAAIAAGAFVYGRGGGEQAIEPRVELPLARAETATAVPSREAAAPEAPEEEIVMAPIVREVERKRAPIVAISPNAPSASPATAPAPAPPAPAPRRADLAREVELVDRAMAALRRGDPAGALAAVRVHVAETAGAGQLAEDAAAIEIEALCRLHDETAAAKLAAFDVRWPASAQRSRLTTRCP